MKDNKSERKTEVLSRTTSTDIFFNYGLRGVGILLNLLYTSMMLDYLGHGLYGMWATITSVASWLNFSDFGIGNGLRNELAIAVAEGDELKQKHLIATAGISLSKIAFFVVVILTVITEVLFATDIMEAQVRLPMYINNTFFGLELILGVSKAAAYGFQLSWLTSLSQTAMVVFRILGVWLLGGIGTATSLVPFSILNGICGIFGNGIIILMILRKAKWKEKSKINKYYHPDYKKSISSLGIQFFVLQIACVVLSSTDNVIINKLISSEAVTEFSLITKVYATGENLFSIMLISLWSAVTYAMTQENYAWIKKSIRKLLLVWAVFSVGVVIVSIFLNLIMQIWLGENAVPYDSPIIILFALYSITDALGSIFVNITNGLGRLKIQMYFAIAAAIANIPLSIFFAATCNMGMFGVKLATWICSIGTNIFVPIDVIRYLRTKN